MRVLEEPCDLQRLPGQNLAVQVRDQTQGFAHTEIYFSTKGTSLNPEFQDFEMIFWNQKNGKNKGWLFIAAQQLTYMYI